MADGIPLSTVRSNGSTTRRNTPGTSSIHGSEANEKLAGRRRKAGEEGLKRRGTGDEVKLNAMGRIYAKIVGFSVITRYMVYVLPVGLLLGAPIVILALLNHRDDIPLGSTTDSGNNTVHGPPLFRLFIWIEITWLSLWVVKSVVWFLPKIFMFFCGIVSAGTRKYAQVLANLVIILSIFFWALTTWLTFKALFNQALNDSIGWVVTVERILGACFVSSAVLLAEKTIVQVIGVSYHQRSFANRIKESKHEIHLLGLLYDASRTLFPMYCHEFAEEDYAIDDSIEMMLRRKAGGKGAPGAATPMKLIGDVGRFGDKVTSVFGNIASEITGKQVFNPNSAHSIVIEALEKTRSSEALGRRLWMSFVVEGRDNLYPDDIEEVLGPAYKKEAEEAFECVDTDANGDISLDEMIRKVVDMGKERKAISEGMKDIGQALRAFDEVLLFVVLLITVFIFLSFFRSSFLTTVATAGTALLSLSFVFAVTTQEFLGSCIFLFVKHPYDVGDRVVTTSTQMIVERISLLYTVFTRTDTNQIVQIPNIVLNNLWIENITRSKAMSESFTIDVSFNTSFEDIELLRVEMENFVRQPENSRDFQPDFTIGVGGVNNLDKLTLNIAIKHKSNWHNDRVRATRRSKFMCALTVALKKIPIYAVGGDDEALGGPNNPTYSVAVSDDFASRSRTKAAKSKDEKRMVPSAGKSSADAFEAERQAISGLNSKNRTGGLGTVVSPTEGQAGFGAARADLGKKESRSGRRKAGEGIGNLPPLETAGAGGPMAGYPQSATSPRMPMPGFDEEAQMGVPVTRYDTGSIHNGRSGYSMRGPSVDGGDEETLHPMASISSGRSNGFRRPQQGPPQGR